MAEKTAANIDELRTFLNKFANSATPWTYVDVHGKTYKVVLVELDEKTPNLDKTATDESAIKLVMLDA